MALSQSSKNGSSNDSKDKGISSSRSSPSEMKDDIQSTSGMLQSLSDESRIAMTLQQKDRFSAFEPTSHDTKICPGSAPPYAGYGGHTMFLSSPREPPRGSENGCTDIYRPYVNHCISDYDSSKRFTSSILESCGNSGTTTTASAANCNSTINYPSYHMYPKSVLEGYQRGSFENSGYQPKHDFGVEMRENEYFYRMTQSMVKEGGIWSDYVPPEGVDKANGMPSSAMHDFPANSRTD